MNSNTFSLQMTETVPAFLCNSFFLMGSLTLLSNTNLCMWSSSTSHSLVKASTDASSLQKEDQDRMAKWNTVTPLQ